ncbi:probable protein arginine N-methyltransferase 6 isoform X5 [Pyrus x bretschneideri]|nr:probable protein arginine N-methyltransferase 6 isoform X5 [Pyrus x bretschneideri]
MNLTPAYSNGYHNQQQQQPQGMSQRDRVRRGTRARSRELRDNFGSGGNFGGLRVSEPNKQQQQGVPSTDFDMAYFHTYAHVDIHEEMIKDRVRTESYRVAIMQHQSSIAGKVVVDIGCGTGILSIFCAQAGAKRVYAVDASDIAVQANEVVKANNLSETIIILHG